MFLKKKSKGWREISGFNPKRIFRGVNFDSLIILESVWKREAGKISDRCSLLGIERDSVVVSTDSSVVSSEIMMRSRSIVKNLNKYFKKPWIRRIKISKSI